MGLRKKKGSRFINEFTVYKIWFYSTSCVLLLVLISSLANFPASLFCQLISSPLTSHKYAQTIQNTSQFTETAENCYSYIIFPDWFLGASLISIKELLCIHEVPKRTAYSLYSNRNCAETWENSPFLSIYGTAWLSVKHMPVKLRNKSTAEAAKQLHQNNILYNQ